MESEKSSLELEVEGYFRPPLSSKQHLLYLKAFPGASIEKKSFEALVRELDGEGKNLFLLSKKGTDIRTLKLKGNEVFIIGDQDGFPQDKKKLLKKIDKISVGPKTLFASQVITIIHNEIDRAERL